MADRFTTKSAEIKKLIKKADTSLDDINKWYSLYEEFPSKTTLEMIKYSIEELVPTIEKTAIETRTMGQDLIMNEAFAKEVLEGRTDLKFDKIVSGFECSFGYSEEGWLCSEIPFITNNRKRNECDFLYYGLLREMNELIKSGNEFVRFGDCIIVVCNMYSPNVRFKYRLDNDNLEVKKLLNVYAAYFLVDDAPDICDLFLLSRTNPKLSVSRSNVFIVPRKDFPDLCNKINSGIFATDMIVKKMVKHNT